MKKFIIICLMSPLHVFAQNTLKYDSLIGSPNASLEAVEWLSGHWVGEAFGGPIEEMWLPTKGESMMFSFKSLTPQGKVRFYEFGAIIESEGSLVLRFKHFNSDLTGWEEKDDFMEFKLVKISDKAIFFDEFTIEKINPDKINHYIVFENDDGTYEKKFEYTRIQK